MSEEPNETEPNGNERKVHEIYDLIEDKKIKDAISVVKAILTSGNAELKEVLINELNRIYSLAPPVLKTLVPELLENFEIKDDLVRYTLILSLKEMCSSDPDLILPFSHEYIGAQNPNKREGMIRIIALIARDHPEKVKEYTGEILECLTDSEEPVRNQAKETLKICMGAFGDDLKPRLLEILKNTQDEDLKRGIEEILQSSVKVAHLEKDEIEKMQLEAINKEFENRSAELDRKEQEIQKKELDEKQRTLEEKADELKRLKEERLKAEAERLEEEHKRQELEQKLKQLRDKEEQLALEEIQHKEEELRKREEEIQKEKEREEALEQKLRDKEEEVQRLEKQLKLEELRRREEELRRRQEIQRKEAELRLVEQELQMKELEARQEELKRKEKERIERELSKLMADVEAEDAPPGTPDTPRE